VALYVASLRDTELYFWRCQGASTGIEGDSGMSQELGFVLGAAGTSLSAVAMLLFARSRNRPPGQRLLAPLFVLSMLLCLGGIYALLFGT
jgi:hypothetical protein